MIKAILNEQLQIFDTFDEFINSWQNRNLSSFDTNLDDQIKLINHWKKIRYTKFTVGNVSIMFRVIKNIDPIAEQLIYEYHD